MKTWGLNPRNFHLDYLLTTTPVTKQTVCYITYFVDEIISVLYLLFTMSKMLPKSVMHKPYRISTFGKYKFLVKIRQISNKDVCRKENRYLGTHGILTLWQHQLQEKNNYSSHSMATSPTFELLQWMRDPCLHQSRDQFELMDDSGRSICEREEGGWITVTGNTSGGWPQWTYRSRRTTRPSSTEVRIFDSGSSA